jgi:hypothetical protein
MKQAPKASRWVYLFAALPKATYLETVKLTPSETNTYLFLVDRLNGNTRDGWTIPVSDQEMIDALGYRRETISRARTGLVEKGLILQVDHEIRRKRVFYVAPPLMVYQMKLCLLAAMLREARKAGVSVETRSPQHDSPLTPPPANNHDSVSTCSQNEAAVNAEKSDGASVSDAPAPEGKDFPSDMYRDILSPVIPVPGEDKTDDKGEKRERDLATIFYEDVLERPLTGRKKRKQVNGYFSELVKDLAERVGSLDIARAVLIDALHRVKGYAPWSHKIMDTDYGERSIEAAIKAMTTAKPSENVTTLTDTASDSTEPREPQIHTPSRAEVDATLLETWSDDWWQKWADEMVTERQRVRQMIIDSGFQTQPLTHAELTAYRQELTSQKPQTDEQKLDWLRNRVDDHAQRKETHRPIDRQPSKPIPESPDERVDML